MEKQNAYFDQKNKKNMQIALAANPDLNAQKDNCNDDTPNEINEANEANQPSTMGCFGFCTG